MKRLTFLFFIALLSGLFSMHLSSCRDVVATEADTVDAEEFIDSFVDTIPVTELEEIVNERSMPKAADELFDDFFFNFAASRKIQKERILWPLEVSSFGETDSLFRNEWQREDFFMEEGFYSLIVDDVKHTRLAKDTTIKHVVVQNVNIPQNSVKDFVFNRIDGKWMMTQIREVSVEESRNAHFLEFYGKFATDTAFCRQSLAESIIFTGPSEEDENLTTTREINAKVYAEWAPELFPNFYNIIYGQKDGSATRKVFIMRGISNSQECQLFFRRNGDRWELYKLVE